MFKKSFIILSLIFSFSISQCVDQNEQKRLAEIDLDDEEMEYENLQVNLASPSTVPAKMASPSTVKPEDIEAKVKASTNESPNTTLQFDKEIIENFQKIYGYIQEYKNFADVRTYDIIDKLMYDLNTLCQNRIVQGNDLIKSCIYCFAIDLIELDFNSSFKIFSDEELQYLYLIKNETEESLPWIINDVDGTIYKNFHLLTNINYEV